MELTIPFDNQSDSPPYEQIYRHIKNEIHRGELETRNHLPSIHVLTGNLGLSRSTTQMAYDQLLFEGYIEALPHEGYFVCKMEELVEVRQKGGGSFVEPRDARKNRYEVDFSPRGIDLDSLPSDTWRKISGNTLVDDNKEMFATGDLQGERTLRTAIRDHLYPARGVDCRPEQILTGVGSECLLMSPSQILGSEGEVTMENPTYKQVYRVLRGEGYSVIPVDMNWYGMDVERLACSSVDVVYVMPSHQYPTEIAMPVKQRQELLAWAYSGTDRHLTEDNYDSEFRYKGKSIPALQDIDRGDRVIYMGTFSRSIVPAIRVDFMALPKHLLEAYQERAGFYLSTVSRIDQNTLYRFIIQGYYERHLNRMRALYKREHDVLITGLKEPEGRFLIRGEYAGLHVLPIHRQGEMEERLMIRVAALGAEACGISRYLVQPEADPLGSIVMLGYASLSEEEIRKGTRLLVKA